MVAVSPNQAPKWALRVSAVSHHRGAGQEEAKRTALSLDTQEKEAQKGKCLAQGHSASC